MANGHGGYRKPNNPAPASGPGSLSRRTDGGPAQSMSAPTGMPYGEHKAMMQSEAVAPMAGTPNISTPDIGSSLPAGYAGPDLSGVVPIGAPSMRPNEPITHGVDIGPGGGSDVLPIEHQPTFQQQGPVTQLMSQLNARDLTGSLAQLFDFARTQGV